jgi:radical SAM protein with 4Fe4S-binding SPASM domain
VVKKANGVGIRIWPGNNLGYFGPLEYAIRRSQQSTGHYRGCNAGTSTIGIESNGELKACPTLGGPTNLGGNVREHSLHDLWSRSPEITYYRRRGVEDLWGYCGECYYKETCMAGCTATGEPIMGRPGNNPFCHHRALEMDRMGVRERLEPVEAGDAGAFGFGNFRIIREHSDEAKRAEHGPVQIDEPRVTRLVEEMGPGRVIDSLSGHKSSAQ